MDRQLESFCQKINKLFSLSKNRKMLDALYKAAKLIVANKNFKIIVYDDEFKKDYFTKAIKTYEVMNKVKNETGSKYSIEEVKELVKDFREINDKFEKIISFKGK